MKETDDFFLVSLDAEAKIIDFNDKVSQISGYTKAEILGKIGLRHL